MKRLLLAMSLVLATILGMVANDLALFEVSGKVRNISGWYPIEGYTGSIGFNVNGKLLANKKLKIKRHPQGQITRLSVYDVDYGMDLSTNVKYDSKGRLAEIKAQGIEGEWTEKYEYDSNNRVIKVTKNGWSEGEEYSEVDTFEYKTFDSKGNWTYRIRTSQSLSMPDAEPYVADEKRRITYYK